MSDEIEMNITRDAYEAGVCEDALRAALLRAADELGLRIVEVDHINEYHPRWQDLHDAARV